MSKVQTSPEALRKFSKQIGEFIKNEEALIKKLSSDCRNIESEWNDAQYKKFEQSIKQIINGIKSAIPECERTMRHLESKAKILDQYNSK